MGEVFKLILCYIVVLVLLLVELSFTADELNAEAVINDDKTLVSAGKIFELGFFSPGKSKNSYLGIWYNNITPRTYVWMANRNKPLHNNSQGVLKIGDDGNLILADNRGRLAWSTEVKNLWGKPTVAQLLDSGNLVLRYESGYSGQSYLWQSFDYPSDTMLAGMKLGWNLRTGLYRNLTSWKSADDPSPGEFSWAIEQNHGLPELVLRKGPVKLYRSRPWNDKQMKITNFYPNLVYNSNIVIRPEEVYFEYSRQSELTRIVLYYFGAVQRQVWRKQNHGWDVIATRPDDQCNRYGQCGSNAICTNNYPRICSCLTGYIPKSSQAWDMFVYSDGCERKYRLNCSKDEGFIMLTGVKLPDTLLFWMNASMTLKECEAWCLANCSCTAYASFDATEIGNDCLLWYGDLIDIRQLRGYDNQVLYIRAMALDNVLVSNSKKKMQFILAITAFMALLAVSVVAYFIWKRTRRHGISPETRLEAAENLELPFFNIVTIAEATNNFSDSNMIGEGGFGPVYKGQLPSGQEIAVKRLSEDSKQGLNEFKNEVLLIVKLQHRNLVRLLGCCIQGEERMLIYEYMSNGSLDSAIFDNMSDSLGWKERFDVIVGIARGLLYLHRDSRLRIIHRDLKASNVLLDEKMNPKISDFGIARAFVGDQLLEKTRRVIGTFGYMSPEYITNGLFSTKSDVFSYGVLVLEIVSGKRNLQFHQDHYLNLLGHAWKLWIEGKIVELVDQRMKFSSEMAEVLRCIQVGLLCVQQCPEDRPSMSYVLSMLDCGQNILAQPKQPGFFTDNGHNETQFLEATWQCTNKLTVSLLLGR